MIIGKQYHVNSVLEFYKLAAADLLAADEIAPRGLKTKEIIAPQIIITDPRNRLVHNRKRKFNILHAVNEAILLFSPSNKVSDISEFNRNMALFSDDGKTMYGSYGKRISAGIQHIISLLREDIHTRQAVLTIHKSGDLTADTKDVPCTETLQFLVRENKLMLIVNMRSNDILYGFQFDVFMFTMLQETVANTLGLELGAYIHNPASLHVYEKGFSFNGYEMLQEMGTNGENIRVTNNSNYREWKQMAHNHTERIYNGELYKYDYSRTVKQIEWLVQQERIYRMLKANNEHISIEYWDAVYHMAPEWARPFLTKWQGQTLVK